MAKKMDFPAQVAFGENPNGVRTEGAFGVSHGGIGEDYYTQYNYGPNVAGERWGGGARMYPVMTIGEDENGGQQNSGEKLKPGR